MTTLPQLTSERLLLRPFVQSDAPRVEQLAGAREVASATLTIPHPYPSGAAAVWIGTHAAAWERGDRLTLAICEIDAPGDILGAISLAIAAEHEHGEIGYWVAVMAWGRGYATEAARSLVSYAFAQLHLHRVLGRHFVRNPASGRVMQKLGMRLEGIHRDAYKRWGKFEDVAVYGILEPEWDSPALRDR